MIINTALGVDDLVTTTADADGMRRGIGEMVIYKRLDFPGLVYPGGRANTAKFLTTTGGVITAFGINR